MFRTPFLLVLFQEEGPGMEVRQSTRLRCPPRLGGGTTKGRGEGGEGLRKLQITYPKGVPNASPATQPPHQP